MLVIVGGRLSRVRFSSLQNLISDAGDRGWRGQGADEARSYRTHLRRFLKRPMVRQASVHTLPP